MQELESSLQSVYQHTADAKAEKEVLLWYAVNLTKCSEDGEDPQRFFEGLDFDEQLENLYQKYEEEEGFEFEATSKICRAIGYWFYNQTATKENLEEFIKNDGQ